MKKEKIIKKKNKFKKKLYKLDKQYKRERRDIVEEWKELMLKCSHPNLQGTNEGYCPDCGYTYG